MVTRVGVEISNTTRQPDTEMTRMKRVRIRYELVRIMIGSNPFNRLNGELDQCQPA